MFGCHDDLLCSGCFLVVGASPRSHLRCNCEHDFHLCCMLAISMSAVALLVAWCLLHAFCQSVKRTVAALAWCKNAHVQRTLDSIGSWKPSLEPS